MTFAPKSLYIHTLIYIYHYTKTGKKKKTRAREIRLVSRDDPRLRLQGLHNNTTKMTRFYLSRDIPIRHTTHVSNHSY